MASWSADALASFARAASHALEETVRYAAGRLADLRRGLGTGTTRNFAVTLEPPTCTTRAGG